MRSWEETLRRLAQDDPCSDTLVALERWLEQRPGYAVTFGKTEQSDGKRVFACAITMPHRAAYQFSSEKGMNVALTLAMTAVARIETSMAEQRARASEQLKPSAAVSVGELLQKLVEPWKRGKPWAE